VLGNGGGIAGYFFIIGGVLRRGKTVTLFPPLIRGCGVTLFESYHVFSEAGVRNDFLIEKPIECGGIKFDEGFTGAR
jgi:hypothetical protein